jgi:cytochrome c556
MRKIPTLILLSLIAGCAPQQSAKPADPQPEYRATATIKDIMDSIVDPGADYIWESVETTVSAKGIEEKRPQTDEEWLQVRRHAIMLLEATNLLQMPGRRVAKEGEKSENPDVELGPEQIQALIDKDRMSWNKYAQALHDATMDSLRAIEAKNADGLLDVSERIDAACENCHKHYWYPDDVSPAGAVPASTEKKGS